MKKILLITSNPTLKNIFAENIRKRNFEVKDFFDEDFEPYQYPLQDKIVNVFRRLFLKDKTFYEKLKNQHFLKKTIEIEKGLEGKFDYILFIRADRFPQKLIENIRKRSNNLIAYQPDGLSVSKKILDFEKYFDRIFVFDPRDYYFLRKKNILPITNCWFPDEEADCVIKNDLFYVGVGVPDRIQKIEKISNFCKSGTLRLNAVLTIQPHYEEKKKDGVFLTHKGMSYSENMENVRKSAALLDFKLSHHNGLSFRFFEAMYYEKKIITNNESVKNYDFYSADNILITDFENLNNITEFLQKPYKKLPNEIVSKYSFDNWLNYVLDLPSYQKIELPKI